MLARFERILEDAVEGSVRRVFPTKLQPVQLAKAAARAMEESQVVGLRGPEVPNSYAIRLSPPDLERFSGYQATLTEQLTSYLEEYAADRGLLPVRPPTVALQGDATVRPGTVVVDARFADLEPHRAMELDQAVESTRAIRVAELRRDPAVDASPDFWLEDSGGARFDLEPSDVVVRLGRSQDNDLVLASQRISRYHAQLRWNGTDWCAVDLDSTNGTFVNDLPVESAPVPVPRDAALRLGDQVLHFRTK